MPRARYINLQHLKPQICQLIGYLVHRMTTHLIRGSSHLLLCVHLAGNLEPNCTVCKTLVDL